MIIDILERKEKGKEKDKLQKAKFHIVEHLSKPKKCAYCSGNNRIAAKNA